MSCFHYNRPFSGKFNDHNEEGSYRCVVCGNRIFTSDDKYNAYCGWPAFSNVVSHESVTLTDDTSHGKQQCIYRLLDLGSKMCPSS